MMKTEVKEDSPSLEHILLANALADTASGLGEQHGVPMDRIKDWITVRHAGIFFTLAGLVLLSCSQLWHYHVWSIDSSQLIHAVGEAFLVAALLIFTVDPLVKRELLKESARGIFKHIIGFDQQPEIKERISELAFNTKLFRENYQVNCKMELLPGAEQVRLDFYTTFEVINPTRRGEKFQQHIAFEKAENATLHEITLISSVDHYTIKDGLKENP